MYYMKREDQSIFFDNDETAINVRMSKEFGNLFIIINEEDNSQLYAKTVVDVMKLLSLIFKSDFRLLDCCSLFDTLYEIKFGGITVQ